jgi:triacylglycerol lipase
MDAFLKETLPKGTGVNFVAHSMGGLDCRHLISSIKPKDYTPLSLTSIATPHHGSPFMDWCAANIGVGSHSMQSLAQKAAIAIEHLPFTLKSPVLNRESSIEISRKKESADALSSFSAALTSYLLNIFDTPAYNNLTTSYLRDHFNPETPNDPSVKYLSVAGRISKMSVLHPLWFTKLVLDSAAEKGYPVDETHFGQSYEGNDGLVSVHSAKWGEFLGVVDGCHHWDLRGEGGLWPQGIVNGDKPKRPNSNSPEDMGPYTMPGGWDWECGVGLDGGPDNGDSQLDPAQHAKDIATARAMSPLPDKKDNESSSAFDLAAVGQIIDWVGDLFPGDKKPAEPTHQLADARREMEAKTEPQPESPPKKTVVRDKYDLARFYGGLMLRLREEGL